MSKTSHLYRRGNTLYFRLSVPDRLRPILKVSEFTQSLRTESRKVATPVAYALASDAKTLFLHIDAMLDDNYTDEEIRAAVAECEKQDMEAARLKSSAISQQVMLLNKQHQIRTQVAEDRHQEELELMKIKTEAEAYRKLTSLTIVGAPNAQHKQMMEKITDSDAPPLSVVYDEFLKGHPTNQGKLETFKKLFIGFVGDKKIDQLTQIEVNEFFFLLVKCGGGRGGNTDAYNALSLAERVALAEKNGDVLMGLGTFKNTYVGAATQFFKWLNLKHAGVAPALITTHINYKDFGGLREKGELKQRALKIAEVERLMQGLTVDKKTKHQYWLMMIALFSGGRVNEICQLNPQHDVILDNGSGVWYFNLTDATAGVDIDGSLKNNGSRRRVPIHSKLLAHGFLEYFERIKLLGHDRIFINFKPKGGKASYYAEEFFRGYLKDVGVHDDKTIGRMVLGMHSVRATFMSHLVKSLMGTGLTKNQAMSKIKPIVGHADGLTDENGGDLTITGGYVDIEIVGDLSNDLVSLKSIIEALDYGIVFSNPISR